MKKGFTLIELLSVIIILAIIALITTPVVINIIDKVKVSAHKSSASGIFNSAKLFYQEKLLTYETKDYYFKCDVDNGCISESEILSFQGEKPKAGEINIDESGNISGWLLFDEHIYSYENGSIVEGFLPNDYVMYSWSIDYFSSMFEKDSYDLLEKLNIGTIYQSFPNLDDDENVKIVNTMLQKGYDVYQLTGQPGWYNNSSIIYSKIDEINLYNTNKDKKIKGIVLDVEFYQTAAWSSDKESTLTSYLNTMQEIINYAHQYNIEVILCLPYWLDNYEQLEELIKISDGVSITNYSNTLINSISKEVELAKKYNKPITNIGKFQNNDSSSYNNTQKSNEDWRNMSLEFNYSKLGYAYHYLNELLDLEMNYDSYNFIVKDTNGQLQKEKDFYIKYLKDDTTYAFSRTTDSDGTFKLFLPQNGTYEINCGYNLINNINEKTIDSSKTVDVVLGDVKTKYTSEIYFKVYNEGKYTALKSTSVTIKSLDTGYTYDKTTHATDGYIALTLRHLDNYTVEINNGKKYQISIDNIDSNISTFKKEATDGTYIVTKIYLKEIN